MADDNIATVDRAVAPTHAKGLSGATGDAPVLLTPIGEFLPPELDAAFTAEALAAYTRSDSKRKVHSLVMMATRKAFHAAILVAERQGAERIAALEARIATLESAKR